MKFRLSSIDPNNNTKELSLLSKFGLNKDPDISTSIPSMINSTTSGNVPTTRLDTSSIRSPRMNMRVPKLISPTSGSNTDVSVNNKKIKITIKKADVTDVYSPIKSQTTQKLRDMKSINSVVWHRTAGSSFNLDRAKKTGIGAHFWIKKDGTIVQTVDTPQRVAWHAGKTDIPYVKNANTIGVEVVGAGVNGKYEDLTPQQKQSIIKLAKYLKKKFGIKKHYWHGEITHRKNRYEGKSIVDYINSIGV